MIARLQSPVSSMSGKLGGDVYCTGSGGAVGRRAGRGRSIQSGPRASTAHALARLSSRWSETLTQSQQDRWAAWATVADAHAAAHHHRCLTAQTAYFQANLPRLLYDPVNLPLVDDAPTAEDRGECTPPITAIKLTATQQLRLTYNSTDAWTTEDGAGMLIAQSRPRSQATNRHNAGFRRVGTILGNTSSPPSSPVTIPAVYPIADNTQTFVRVEVSRRDGRLHLPFRDHRPGTNGHPTGTDPRHLERRL